VLTAVVFFNITLGRFDYNMLIVITTIPALAYLLCFWIFLGFGKFTFFVVFDEFWAITVG